MAEDKARNDDNDPAPLQHVDAQRLSSDESQGVSEGEDTQGQEETEQEPG